jgi:nitrogen-specific signal transduction histidine kinase
MDNGLRKSGIEAVGNVRWGTHLCQFVKTKEDFLELLVPYFKAGLESNEFCMWVTSDPLTVEDAEEALKRAVPDYESRKENGQIEIIPHTDWYLKDGYFDLQRVFDGWIGKLEAALDRGFEGLRATGNTGWLEADTWECFTEYEEELDHMIGDYEMMAVCTYSLDKCGASEVIDVVKNHQYALIKRDGRWENIENSHRKRARDELASMSEELLEVNRELDSYARAVSHDLRGPLAAITLANEMLKESAIEGATSVEDLCADAIDTTSTIQRNLARCFDMIDDLLALAEAGQKPVAASSIEVASVVKEILVEQSRNIKERGMEVLLDEDLGTVHANKTQIYQIFSNLIVNAMRHNDSAKPVIEVRYRGKENGDTHRYVIKDNGPGISAKQAEFIFKPFFKYGASSDTGLGLSIVKKAVEAYDGEIRVRNDDGALFEFTIKDA